MCKPSILLLYDYFTPAYKAGGPIQSLNNLVAYLKNDFRFSVVTGAYDKGESRVLNNIKTNEWNAWDNDTEIFYWTPSIFKLGILLRLLRKPGYDVVYINGLYSPYFSILPLFFCKQKIILAPRGMLHAGALSQKTGKKKFFLAVFKFLKWHRKVKFHATDEAEKKFIIEKFGPFVNVQVAPNIPKNIGELPAIIKMPGELRLVSIALISPMKNFELVLEALKLAKGNIEYSIYGPVINQEYWNRCLKVMQEMPPQVKVIYKGGLHPNKVQEALQNNHIFILPSVSENFGHAIFESFSAARPVITSNNTPWNNLKTAGAGWNIDTNIPGLVTLLNELAGLDDITYTDFCKGAKKIADDYFNTNNFREAYQMLFL